MAKSVMNTIIGTRDRDQRLNFDRAMQFDGLNQLKRATAVQSPDHAVGSVRPAQAIENH